jgi:hypothetical protein
MTSFIVACVAIVVLAVGAAMVLNHYNEPVDVAFATSAVRI